VSDSERLAQKSEECRQQALRALSPEEKASWLNLAREWQALAEKIASTEADTNRE
jgi:hypothetical protein